MITDKFRKDVIFSFIVNTKWTGGNCSFNQLDNFISDIPDFFFVDEPNLVRKIRRQHNKLIDLLCELQEENKIVCKDETGERFILHTVRDKITNFILVINPLALGF